MRGTYINLGLSIPCKFNSDESYRNFQDYVDSKIEKISIDPITYGDLTFEVADMVCEDYNLISVYVEISGLQGEHYMTSDDSEEDAFIAEYSPVLESYIENTLIPQINAELAQDNILSSLPYAYALFSDGKIYVEVDYGQTSIDLVCYPAEVDFDLNVEDIVSDLYYTEES